MGDYNIAFKYNKPITSDNSAYPWPLNWDKYSLDRKMLNEDLRSGGLVERSRAAAADQLNDPVTRMRFLQGKGQANGVSLASLHRRSILDGSAPMFFRRAPKNDFLFQQRQQADNWTDRMNTQDQNQKVHIPLGNGGNINVALFDQAVKDASATPATQRAQPATGGKPIPPTPGSVKRLAQRYVRREHELLTAQLHGFQAMDARSDIMRMVRDARRSEAMDTKTMKADKKTNLMVQPTADPSTDQHSALKPRDILASGIKRKLESKKSKAELLSEQSWKDYQGALQQVEDAYKKDPAPHRGRSMSSTKDNRTDSNNNGVNMGVNVWSYFSGKPPMKTPDHK